MKRLILGIWAVAGVVLLAVGCQSELVSGLIGTKTDGNGNQVIVGSLQTVAVSTQGKLQELGLSVVRTDEAGAVRLSCTNRTGGRFNLVLTSERTYQGVEQTRVRLEWHEGRDDQLGVQVLAHVQKQSTGR
jgi:hypothetical protein